jgi:hypothetical protein
VMVRDMRLLKRYEKTGGWTEYVDERPKNKLARLFEWDEYRQKWFRKRFETQILTVKRKPFRFATSEPFADILLDWLDNAKRLPVPWAQRTVELQHGLQDNHGCRHLPTLAQRAKSVLPDIRVWLDDGADDGVDGLGGVVNRTTLCTVRPNKTGCRTQT